MTSIAGAAAAAHAPIDPPRTAAYRPAHPLNLFRTVGVLMRGPKDPTMVVDGKYFVSPNMSNGLEGLLKVTDHLIERARKERAKR